MSVQEKAIGDVMIPGSNELVTIPVPPEYKGGRRESFRTRYIWSSVGFVVTVLFSLMYLMFSGNSMLSKLLFVAVLNYTVVFIIRRTLGEKKHRKELQERFSRDYEIDLSNFWGIKKITENDFCYYRQAGVTGLFILFEKGSIAGKGTQGEYDHKFAMGEALKEIGSRPQIKFLHLDLMDDTSSDIRILFAREAHKKDSESGAKNLRTAIFNKIQDDSESTTATYDIFIFLTNDDDLYAFEQELEPIIKKLQAANFSQFRVLNYAELRNIAMSLYNLQTFNLAETMRKAFTSTKSKANFRLIETVDIFGEVEQQEQTIEAERAERERKARIKRESQEELKRLRKERKRKSKSHTQGTAPELESASFSDDFDDVEVLKGNLKVSDFQDDWGEGVAGEVAGEVSSGAVEELEVTFDDDFESGLDFEDSWFDLGKDTTVGGEDSGVSEVNEISGANEVSDFNDDFQDDVSNPTTQGTADDDFQGYASSLVSEPVDSLDDDDDYSGYITN